MKILRKRLFLVFLLLLTFSLTFLLFGCENPPGKDEEIPVEGKFELNGSSIVDNLMVFDGYIQFYPAGNFKVYLAYIDIYHTEYGTKTFFATGRYAYFGEGIIGVVFDNQSTDTIKYFEYYRFSSRKFEI